MDLRTKAETLRRLHHGPEPLVLPNAWDVASARVIEAAGFPVIATTSAAVAWAQGFPDGEAISRDEMLSVCARMAARVRVPVTADLEAGYGPKPEDAAETIRRAIAAGVAGANLEDGTHRREQPLYPLEISVARIRAARQAAEAAGIPFVLNARTDSYLAARIFGREPAASDFDETVRRGRAYREAGADCIFIPGLEDRDTIARLVKSLGGPINIMAGPRSPSVPELKALGVARISVGSLVAAAAFGFVRRAAAELLTSGTYGFSEGMIPHPEMNKLLTG
jgi:2-methylisocitrate lyase-like PEP mutase family enzyme